MKKKKMTLKEIDYNRDNNTKPYDRLCNDGNIKINK